MQLEFVRPEIERMRIQVHQQRGEIRQLQRAGIPAASAEALLERMLNMIDELCVARDRLKKEQPGPTKGKCLEGADGRTSEMVRRQGHNPSWITALAEVRHRACREGWCHHHVQAIIESIDQYAEAALDNRGCCRSSWPTEVRADLNAAVLAIYSVSFRMISNLGPVEVALVSWIVFNAIGDRC
jgi:hypothetical protein